ncbi:MAG: hydroxymethylglutaryl-CoA synthase [Candidatus Hydrothermarchaeaceae archaeon]
MKIGIVGYGAYVPRFRIKVEEIAKVWGKDPANIKKGLRISEKSVPDLDEDTTTISVEAGRNALRMSRIDPNEIGAIYIGSESHPYTVKPTATIVAEALEMSPEDLTAASYEFACKAGTAAMQTCMGLVKSEIIKYGLAIGADTAQGAPGDALEFTAAAGGAAFIIGRNGVIANFEGTYSYTTDTPDFWRREGQSYPSHGGRFTGEPAYFKHVHNASKGLMDKLGLKPSDFKYAIFHQPNGKFPRRVAGKLGLTQQQIEKGLLVDSIGNTYSGSSLLGLARVLDDAQPGDRILLTSFGSGAGGDSFSIMVKDGIEEKRRTIPRVEDFQGTKEYIDYAYYVKLRKKIRI